MGTSWHPNRILNYFVGKLASRLKTNIFVIPEALFHVFKISAKSNKNNEKSITKRRPDGVPQL